MERHAQAHALHARTERSVALIVSPLLLSVRISGAPAENSILINSPGFLIHELAKNHENTICHCFCRVRSVGLRRVSRPSRQLSGREEGTPAWLPARAGEEGPLLIAWYGLMVVSLHQTHACLSPWGSSMRLPMRSIILNRPLPSTDVVGGHHSMRDQIDAGADLPLLVGPDFRRQLAR